MRKTVHVFACFFMALVFISDAAAEPQLYETGPTEESSYVRFVNATDADVTVVASKKSAKIDLSVRDEGRTSRFFTVKAGSKLTATIHGKTAKSAIEVVGKPWEYITIAILPDGAARIKTVQLKETPDDFNAMRSSVALFNLDAQCGSAFIQGGAKNTAILENVQPFSVQRRLINPVKLSAKAGCDGQSTPVEMAQLQAGERYSVFLMTLNHAQKAFFVRDTNKPE